MGGHSGIRLNKANFDTAVQSLKGLGAVRFSNVIADDAGANQHLFVRPGSRLQALQGYFSSRKTREAYANQICTKLRQVFGEELTGELLHDVRSKIIKTGSLKGDFLAEKIADLQKVFKASTGTKLRLTIGSPIHERSDCCIVSFSSASKVSEEYLSRPSLKPVDWISANLLNAWGNRKGNFDGDVSLSWELAFADNSMKKLVSLRDYDDAVWSQRQPGDMYALIRQAIGNSTGAIVIEPQPDRKVNGVPMYTDEGLREQLNAAAERRQDAANKGVNRVITFVSPNSELLARIQTLTLAMSGNAATQKSANSTT